MKKVLLVIASFFLLSGILGNAYGFPSAPTPPQQPSAPKPPEFPSSPFTLPKDSVKVADDVFKLKPTRDPATGVEVEGFAIVHKKDHPKRLEARRNRSARRTRNTCYGFLSSGAKWKSIEPWMVNTTNSNGLSSDFIFNNLTSDIAKWEDAADGVVGNGLSIDILGDGSVTSATLSADTTSPDDNNELYFGEISDPDTIAVTIVWGIFGGRTSARRLIEWDQIYNTSYLWSSTGESDKMDFENIATHELGHSVGLADLYQSQCSEETMYGYATYGQTIKRDLNPGDITGINTLY